MDLSDNAADYPLGIRSVLWLQSFFGEESWAQWNFITELGTPPVFMVVIGFLFWQGRRSAGICALVAILMVGMLVDLLKVFIAMPRPYYAYDLVAAWRDSTGFGMPSGHAAGAMTLWLLLAVFIRKWWFSIIAAALIFFIGLSRMYFGVHSGTQVLFGWLLGISVVLIIINLRKPVTSWYERTTVPALTLAIAATVLMLFGVQYFAIEPMADKFTVPALWNERFNLAVKFEDYLDGDVFKPKTLMLFNAVGLSELGPIVGTGIILLWWKVKNRIALEEKPISGSLLALTTVIGLLATFLLVFLIDLTENVAVLAFIVWVSVPILLALVVPFAGIKIRQQFIT